MAKAITHAWVQAWIYVPAFEFGGNEDGWDPGELTEIEIKDAITLAARAYTNDELEIDIEPEISIAYEDG